MPADPRRVKELLAAVLDLPDAHARQAFLERECAGDAELCQRLEALLHAHDQPQLALDRPLVGLAPAKGNPTGPFCGPAVEERPGAMLAGKYKLIERIGEGGMGSVWMAQQTEPVKRMVAVKLIKSGDDSKAILARFEAERQALALMDHPNIARVLDGGVADDPGEPSRVSDRVNASDDTRSLTRLGSPRPFFVMELVKGVPITTFCDARKLTPRQRLELFVPVCQAIQHAHQKGIIHRDVKPSNVLIALYDDRPVPKVIDFGVAKATGTQLTEQTLHTGFGSIVGTLEYMSPEQATLNNLDIDTRSDIYSLGVLLYELLAGGVPFRRKDAEKAGMLEMLRVIREEEPPKPSTRASTAEALPSLAANRGMEPAKLTRQLRGEIDWIIMKALEKDRARRYETANGFAMDIQRYLADEPVQAGPPSAAYRLKKFVKRHKGQVLAAVVVLLVLLSGISGTTWGLVRAETARKAEREQRQIAEEKQRDAEEQKERAQKAEKQTLEDYRASTDDAIEQLIGSKSVLGPQEKTYLEKTLKRWQVFAARIGDDQRSRAIRAEGQCRVAQLRQKLGESEEAAAGYREAMAIWQKLADEFPAVTTYRRELAVTHNNLGLLLHNQNLWTKAAEQYHKCLAILQKLADEFPAVTIYRNDLAGTHNNLGNLLKEQNQGEKAAEQFHEALAIRQKLADEFPAETEFRRELADCHNNLGILLAAQNLQTKAAEQFHRALEILQKLADECPVVPDYRKSLAGAHDNLAILLTIKNQGEKAAEHYQESLAIRQKLADDFRAVPKYQVDLGGSCCNYGNFLRLGGKSADSLPWYDKAISTLSRVHQQNPTFATPKLFLCYSYQGRAMAYDRLAKYAEAVQDWNRATELSPLQQQAAFRAGRADSRVRAGQVNEGMAEVAELMKAGNWPAPEWYNFACVCAVASTKSADKKQEYADRAMELLDKAVKAGFKNAAHIMKDKDLEVLRQRDDFKQLLADLDAAALPKKTKEP